MPRDDQILYARIGGATWREIGQRYQISHEGARHIYARIREPFIDLLVAKVRRHLEDNDTDYELAIPPPFRDNPEQAARFAGWVTGALAERGVLVTSALFGLHEATR
jgi:hypothetical protein